MSQPVDNRPHPDRPLPRPRRWASIRGRYFLIAAAFSLLLLGAAWVANIQVLEASRRSDVNLVERETVLRTLRAVADHIWEAETALQTFMLVPGDAARRRAETSLIDAAAKAGQVLSADSIFANEADRELVEGLRTRLGRLRREIGRLMDMRTSPEKLFPAMPIMIERMLPEQTTFNTAAGLAINEMESDPAPQNHEIYRLFADARYASTQMVGAFRVWVANRFGIFGEPETAMAAQAVNIRQYAERVDRDIEALIALDRRGTLDLQHSLSLQQMMNAHREWLRQYRQVAAIFTSERWRTDTPLMRDTVQPLFVQTWSALREIEKTMEGRSTADLSSLAGVADALSRAIWLLAGVGLAVAALGYLLFEFSVRRPIARVAHALKAEAAGKSGAVPLEASTREIGDLMIAFDHMRRQVHSRQQRLETILDHAAEGIITFDESGVIERFNKAAERLFGYAEGEIVGKDIGTLIVPPERRPGYVEHFMRTEIQRLIGHEGEVTGRHKDGSSFAMALKISRMQLDGRVLYTGLVADISERKAMVEHLKNMAEHDGLTGLYNRTYFQQELERVVERAHRTKGHTCAVLYLDLDNFKYVNDTLGHAAGDRLLIEVAGILHKRARKSDLISRFGGDEFMVLLYDTTPELALRAAESFRKKLVDYHFQHDGERVDIGCSIGVAAIGPDTASAEEALSQADLACHLAKRNGRNQVHAFRPSDADNVAAMSIDMGVSRRIKEAIAHDRFALACQPIVSTGSRAVEAYEVLIRMLDDSGQLIMPSGFLPAAERFGLAADIDRWVIANAIESLARQRKTAPTLRYSINLSGQTLSQPVVCDLVQEKLRETGLDPTALIFEVTETVAIADMATAQVFLSRLREMGCRTALDDFGSGMSSFAYLRDLPVDFVKIDGRFVRNLAGNEVDRAMVKAMNEIVHALGKRTIAEFVENEASFRLLAEFGVDYAQGYHLGRPDVTLPCREIADRCGAVACGT
ncbi:diguanylate cyclase [Sulfurifustis variabilis]|uniref:Diguanylate cyclase n=1 Tax=Sulfurifustis variabilis TaxID=1675686 RepID=A0A1B4V3V4_9GAMM|nr:EAL domain-containing protein [Sulfurifustis variabilis]BAU48065.1 diguanylate cyclase [Sulfurifustis variabilis]